ncbi:MAG: efflux RND transporter permease subunit, partial [Candidatus Obscuribacterales bacterium]|nr:efflux RND transporter permease subunit [Candidatus Obscuribacterales bacterium]
MWIVRLALTRPHTFIVMAITIAIFGVLSIAQMAVDIFPSIDVPIVSCIWTYTGMSPYYIENLVTTVTETWLTSTVNGIERMESMSLSGMSVIKVYLHKGSDIGEAVATVTAVGNAVLDYLPPGITPPFVTVSSATDVPVIQLQIGSKTLSEAELFDIANNFVRNQLATIQGATIPFPYGGKYRQVMIDLNPSALVATGLSANDVVQVVNSQSIIAPSGTAKMGTYEYIMTLNNIPKVLDHLNNIPLKSYKGAVVYLRDVANAHDGYQPQLNIVNKDGRRAVLFSILKNGDASTLSVVNRIKEALPRIQAIVPKECQITLMTDQSIFVKECV